MRSVNSIGRLEVTTRLLLADLFPQIDDLLWHWSTVAIFVHPAGEEHRAA